MSVELSEILELPVSERIKLVGDIWDSIAADADSVRVTAEQGEELDRRIAYLRDNLDESGSWSEVRNRTFEGLYGAVSVWRLLRRKRRRHFRFCDPSPQAGIR